MSGQGFGLELEQEDQKEGTGISHQGSEGSRRGWAEDLTSRVYKTWDDLSEEEVWAPRIPIVFGPVLGSYQPC